MPKGKRMVTCRILLSAVLAGQLAPIAVAAAATDLSGAIQERFSAVRFPVTVGFDPALKAKTYTAESGSCRVTREVYGTGFTKVTCRQDNR